MVAAPKLKATVKVEMTTGRLKPHESIAWAAMEKHAKKEAERTTLPVGTHKVELAVSGKVNGRGFATEVAGTLNVAPDTVRSTSESAPQESIVAWLLKRLCRSEKQRVLNELPEVWQDELPKLTAAEVEQAKQLLARLTARTGTAPQRGAVKFSPGG